jgi:hypothetical protein
MANKPKKTLSPAARRRIRLDNTLYNPLATLSGKDLRKAVAAEVNLQIKPKLRAYDRGIASLTGQRNVSAARLNDYNTAYGNQARSSAAALSSTAQQLAAQMAAQGQQNQAQLSNLSSGISSREAADVALRGPGLQDNSAAQGAVALAQAQQAGRSADYQAQAGATGAGFAGLAGTIAAVAPMRASDQMATLANTFNKQIVDMQSRRADVASQRGDLTQSITNKMRNDQFTNFATAQGLNIRQGALNEQIRSAKADERLANKTLGFKKNQAFRDAKTAKERFDYQKAKDAADLDIKRGIDPITGKRLPKGPRSAADALNKWRLKFAQQHGYLPSTGPAGGKGAGSVAAITPNEKAKQVGKASSVGAQIETGIKSKGGTKKYPRSQAARDYLSANPGIDPLYVSVALDMQYDGHVSRVNAKKLHTRGLTVKDLGLVDYKTWVKKNKSASKAVGNQFIPGGS